jgi:hypothetical protein
MNWRVFRWWLLGAAMYVVFLAGNLPATYLSPWLSRHFPGIQLGDISGTVLSGHAAEVRVQNQRLGSLSWSFDWLAPFTAAYGYRFDLEDDHQSLQGRADLRLGSVYLRDLSGHVPVAALDRWVPLPQHSVDGMLEINLRSLLLKNDQLTSAEGEITLQDGNLNWPASFPLGSFRLKLSPADGGGTAGQLSDLASPLKLQCALSLSPAGHYHLKGTLAARDPGDPATQKFLAYLGSADTSGHYPFDFSGQW